MATTAKKVEYIDQSNTICNQKFQPSYEYPVAGQTFRLKESGLLTGIEVKPRLPNGPDYDVIIRDEDNNEIARKTFSYTTVDVPIRVNFDIEDEISLEADKKYSFSLQCKHPMVHSIIVWVSVGDKYDRGCILDNDKDGNQFEFESGLDMYFKIFITR